MWFIGGKLEKKKNILGALDSICLASDVTLLVRKIELLDLGY